MHEDFICQSLEKANIDFSEYLRLFENLLELKGKKQRETDKELKIKIETTIKNEEEKKKKLEEILRKKICELYQITAKEWNNKFVDEKGKPLFKKKSYDILTEAPILKFLEMIYRDDKEKISIIHKFHGFFTYFTGFNQNRENYYSDKELSTGVANRIINENLPKFCQNICKFSKSRELFESEQELKKHFDIFELKYYNNALTQDGIDKYNGCIGEFNHFVSHYNQQHKNKTRLQSFNTLFKQIGSLKKKKEFIFEIDEKDNTLEKVLNQFVDQSARVNKKKKILKLSCILCSTEDLNGIYINKKSISEVSRMVLANWDTLSQELVEAEVWHLNKETEYPKEKENTSLQEIVDSLKGKESLFKEEFQKFDEKNRFLSALTHLLKLKFDFYESNLTKLKILLEKKSDLRKKESKDVIKGFCDSAIDLIRFVRLFSVKTPPENINTDFYNLHKEILEDPDYPVFKWYDAIRNNLTKKPYSLDKIKLNFDKGNLLGGWTDSPIGNTQYSAFLFRKESEYFLGICLNTRLFDENKNPHAYKKDGKMEKMVFTQLDAKTIYGSIYRGKYKSKYSDDKKVMSDSELIDRIKSILESQKKHYTKLDKIIQTKFDKATDLARVISTNKFYSLNFVNISEEYLRSSTVNADKPLYLFKITNKDFSKKDKSKKDNLHTKYWKVLFENKDNIIKLNGQAELFFRPASIKEKDKVKVETFEKKRIIDHAIKHARFARDHYEFHVPITLNFGCGEYKKITDKVRDLVKSKKAGMNIIGIDRGEKHLAYYSIIDPNGNILEQGSLNKDLLGKDYAQKLEKIAKERQEARKNWEEITRIKDIKEGYISQVVKRIADLAVKYEALIVFEDLNIGFKRGRQKIESSVYQKLELAIAKKLSFYVSKESEENEIGSVTKALQLVPPINNYGDIKGKQFGIILYTRANYTSQTDPLTGWRKSIYIKKGSNQYIKSQILDNFSDIYFDGEDYVFVYKDDNDKEWRLYSGINGRPLDRYRGKKGKSQNTWIIEKQDHVKILDTLFSKFDKKRSIHAQIKEGIELTKDSPNVTSYESLKYAIDLIMQIRNTGIEESDKDFILSPVRNEDGIHFDSRKAKKDQPDSGDANGAYNIARKGLLMCKRIIESEKPDLFIKEKEWDKAASNWDKEFVRQKWTM